MAEPIDLLFGLWTHLGSRKHKFNRICQVAPQMCPHGGHIGATWQIRLNCPSVAAMQPYIKLLWSLVINLLLLVFTNDSRVYCRTLYFRCIL